MNKKYLLWLLVVMFVPMLLATGSVPAAVAQDGVIETQPLAQIEIMPNQITWHPNIGYPYDALILSIYTNGTLISEQNFAPQTLPILNLSNAQRIPLPDGLYAYTLRVQWVLSPNALAALQSARASGDVQALAALQASGVLPPEPYAQTGEFLIRNSAFLAQPSISSTGKSDQDDGANHLDDVVHIDDLIVVGSQCVGTDCANGEVFDYTTIKLKENNLRITFDDTSAAGTFPNVDWQLTVNESVSGGLNKFSIEDLTNAKIPFTILANAPTNAFYVDASGRVGMGTAMPYVELHLVNGNIPTVRLDQDTSSGWSAQTWDIAGNEQNFFIRDATGVSTLPFRIQPDAPNNTLTLRADGAVGVGTWSPSATLHVYSTTPTLLVSRTDGKTTLSLDSSGNLLLGGLLTESSDINLKENLRRVNSNRILDLVASLPIYTWNYREDQADTTHIGPMAQDFYAAFELGADDKHIAALDVNGVTLASVQALYSQITAQQTQIAQLEQQNAELEARLARLETSAGLGASSTVLYVFIAGMALAFGVAAMLMWRTRARF